MRVCFRVGVFVFVCECQWGKVVGSTLVERGSSVIPHHPHLNPNSKLKKKKNKIHFCAQN